MQKKKLVLITIILSLLLVNSNLFAQITEAKAIETVEKFFAFSKKNDFKNAANLLAYYGDDKSRIYKDFFNPKNPDELKEIRRICKKINAILLISDSVSFGKFRERVIDKKKFKSLDVLFLSGEQKIRRKILFLEINGKPAIFDYS